MTSGRTATRRVLLGDWTPVVRDPIDVLRLTFAAGAAVALVTGDITGAVRLALTFALVVAPRLMDAPRPFDLLFVLGMALQGFGNAFELFDNLGWYDKLVHFVLPFAVAPLLYILLVRLDAVPDPQHEVTERHGLGILIITFALGTTVGVAYELYEYAAVKLLGASLEIGYADTIADLIDNSLGTLGGAALLLVWSRFGWAASRRLPPDRWPE